MARSIWVFQRAVSRRLLNLNVVNIAIGALLGQTTPFWRGVGSQSVGWGAINIVIAEVGRRGALRRLQRDDAHSPETRVREARNLRNLLWLNAGLDILYMMGGWRHARSQRDDDFKHGIGIGIIAQGMLLFLFDVVHALRVPRER